MIFFFHKRNVKGKKKKFMFHLIALLTLLSHINYEAKKKKKKKKVDNNLIVIWLVKNVENGELNFINIV